RRAGNARLARGGNRRDRLRRCAVRSWRDRLLLQGLPPDERRRGHRPFGPRRSSSISLSFRGGPKDRTRNPRTQAGAHGFRVRGFAAPRNDKALFRSVGEAWWIGKDRHDVAGEAADVVARAAEIDDDIFDAGRLQGLELARDLI